MGCFAAPAGQGLWRQTALGTCQLQTRVGMSLRARVVGLPLPGPGWIPISQPACLPALQHRQEEEPLSPLPSSHPPSSPTSAFSLNPKVANRVTLPVASVR